MKEKPDGICTVSENVRPESLTTFFTMNEAYQLINHYHFLCVSPNEGGKAEEKQTKK